ncbi:MAG: MBL fold metallo-hydrolase [Helicobacteraceae bacterium]|jgi:glyoxylase-like metal-dependent hydrolase (beta-lactamase superfamily II)|nr:MBL fold metallo-hydrolase [Helicobacteraceae bacterium]
MLVKQMGRGYQTNCYLLVKSGDVLIVDPGIGAFEWIAANAKGAVAALNTHGHFDHVYSDAILQKRLRIPIYIRQEDNYMLARDYCNTGMQPCVADVCVRDEEWIEIGAFRFRFVLFSGHTPGCSMIEFEDRIFSGDFIFSDCIGRYDFLDSSASDMKRSLERFMDLYDADDRALYPGHGEPTSIQKAKAFVPEFIRALS